MIYVYSTMFGARETCYHSNISVGAIIVNETYDVVVEIRSDIER